MKATGYVRRVDQLGRVVLPRALRRELGLEDGTPIAIAVDGEDIVLEKHVPRCVFCRQPTEATVSGKLVCPACQAELAARARGQARARP